MIEIYIKYRLLIYLLCSQSKNSIYNSCSNSSQHFSQMLTTYQYHHGVSSSCGTSHLQLSCSRFYLFIFTDYTFNNKNKYNPWRACRSPIDFIVFYGILLSLKKFFIAGFCYLIIIMCVLTRPPTRPNAPMHLCHSHRPVRPAHAVECPLRPLD